MKENLSSLPGLAPLLNSLLFLNLTDINFEKESIIQEFIDKPFLIDGRKFSIGVFVIFSSANPLRAYMEDNMFALRFSPVTYDVENLDPRMYVTDGMEFGLKFIRQVSIGCFVYQ